MIYKEVIGNELYVYLNGSLLYKRWLDQGHGVISKGGMYSPFRSCDVFQHIIEPINSLKMRQIDETYVLKLETKLTSLRSKLEEKERECEKRMLEAMDLNAKIITISHDKVELQQQLSQSQERCRELEEALKNAAIQLSKY